MPEFQLISNGQRSVISPVPWAGKNFPEDEWSPRSCVIEAPSWLAAKQALGFELTEVQKGLLSAASA